MTVVWIGVAIALLLLCIWAITTPKQGHRATNAPPASPPDALPSGIQKSTSSPPDALSAGGFATPSAPTPTFEAEIRELAATHKILAIKRTREHTGWGLKQAKNYVESLAADTDSSRPIVFERPRSNVSSSQLTAEVQKRIATGKKIAAIKYVRTVTGWGLKEAKDYVESLPPQSSEAEGAVDDQALQELLAKHQKLEAINLLTHTTGMGLAEAKAYIENLMRR